MVKLGYRMNGMIVIPSLNGFSMAVAHGNVSCCSIHIDLHRMVIQMTYYAFL